MTKTTKIEAFRALSREAGTPVSEVEALAAAGAEVPASVLDALVAPITVLGRCRALVKRTPVAPTMADMLADDWETRCLQAATAGELAGKAHGVTGRAAREAEAAVRAVLRDHADDMIEALEVVYAEHVDAFATPADQRVPAEARQTAESMRLVNVAQKVLVRLGPAAVGAVDPLVDWCEWYEWTPETYRRLQDACAPSLSLKRGWGFHETAQAAGGVPRLARSRREAQETARALKEGTALPVVPSSDDVIASGYIREFAAQHARR